MNANDTTNYDAAMWLYKSLHGLCYHMARFIFKAEDLQHRFIQVYINSTTFIRL